jgi:hypothetical protein
MEETQTRFVEVCLEYGALKKESYVVNAYSRCDFSHKLIKRSF